MKLLLAFVAIVLILAVLGIIDLQGLLSEAVNAFFDFMKTAAGGLLQ